MAEAWIDTGVNRSLQGQESVDLPSSHVSPMPSAPSVRGILFDPNLVPSQFQFDSFVVDRRDYKKTQKLREGYLTFEDYTMSDGFHYHVMTGIPSHQRTGVSVDMSTAWWTGVEGHNMHTALGFMKMGLPVRLISGELIDLPSVIMPWHIKDIVAQLSRVELARSAHNKLQILHVNDSANRYTITPNVSIAYGESRDAMIHPGEQFLATTALDQTLQRFFMYSEDVDPACSDPLELGLPSHEQVARVWAEIKAAKHVGWRILTSSLRKHYKHTPDFSPSSLLPQIATAPTLFSGQAGELALLAPNIPRSINTFVMSAGLTGDGFENRYEGKDLTKFFDVDGAHLNIPDIMPFVKPALLVVRDHLEANSDDPRGLDVEHVWAAKQKAIDTIKAA